MAAPARSVEDLLAQHPGTLRRGRVLEAREARGAGHLLPTGCDEIDTLLGGGIPRGRLVEFLGRGSASVGVTSLAHHLLRGVTLGSHPAAWVDVANAFDPTSAAAAGVVLPRLLWVRPPDLVAAFAATEILLATGGFTLVVLDTTGGHRNGGPGNPSRQGRQDRKDSGAHPGRAGRRQKGQRMLVAPQTWIRLARAAERSQSTLLVLPGGAPPGRDPGFAGTAAGVRVELSRAHPLWEGVREGPSLLEGLSLRAEITRNRKNGLERVQSCRTRIGLP